MKDKIALRPSYWASVSGGKDSLYMLNLILHNLDKYPLDGVVHYELEIDYPFIKNVIDCMEDECKRYKIPFVRLKPKKTWNELYDKYGFPTYRPTTKEEFISLYGLGEGTYQSFGALFINEIKSFYK